MHSLWKKLWAIVLAVGGVLGAFALGVALVTMASAEKPAALSLVRLPQGALIGKAAVIYDPGNGVVLFQKDANEPLPLASLTKLMTATVALKNSSPSTLVPITQDNIAPNNNCCIVPGEVLTLRELIRLSLTVSSNDAITAAASSAGSNYLEQMNDEAAAMALTQTRKPPAPTGARTTSRGSRPHSTGSTRGTSSSPPPRARPIRPTATWPMRPRHRSLTSPGSLAPRRATPT